MDMAIHNGLNTQFDKALTGSKYQHINELGWEAFKEVGWPTRKHEEYKYTALAQIFKRKFDFEAAAFQPQAEPVKKFYPVKGHHLVFINGRYSADHSDLMDDDLTITSFDDMDLNDVQQVVEKQKDQRATVAINQAFLQGGVVLHAPKSAVINPVFIYHFSGGNDSAAMSFPRIHVKLDANAEMRIYETYQSVGEHGHFTSLVTTAEVDQDAVFRFTKIQSYKSSDFVLDNFFIEQEAKSHCFVNTYSFSGGLIRNNLEIGLNGEHAEANMYGTYLLDSKSHVDNHTVVDHRVADCNSNELYKGIMEEQATAVFNGKIFVRQPAQHTNAFQANNNISLSDAATIHTKPQLEIWADDVSCSHGCTIGQLDEEAMFYLKSRGIPENKAKSMLLGAFAKETLRNVHLEEIQEEILSNIHKRLEL